MKAGGESEGGAYGGGLGEDRGRFTNPPLVYIPSIQKRFRKLRGRMARNKRALSKNNLPLSENNHPLFVNKRCLPKSISLA